MEINKPIITYVANESSLPQPLKTTIVQDLPQESIEWQRSYGRPSKTVYIETQLVPLSDQHIISQEAGKNCLLERPLLHTFWLECESETYKNSTKEELIVWINKLRDEGINEWLVVIIEGNESKKANKSKLLPRTSVVDRIKADFPPGIKNSFEHCVSLLDTSVSAIRGDPKASESYQHFLYRLRNLLLTSYSRHLTVYEDFIRLERERRNATDWNFFHFFFLQEELAFAFETMSLYDEALVQYDELDALFSQFVINSNVDQMADWLQKLSDDCQGWNGLCLSNTQSWELRLKLKASKGSLLDLRNYLFARQCELLLLHNKPWEVALRSLPFLQNCVNELKLLEINLVPGAVACWVFLSAVEILQKCERYSDSSQMETYSRHTVGLWAYARKKLEELGILCGLMPDMNHTSKCIHRVVSLIAGIGDDPYADKSPPSPQARLKEALSKPEAFLKIYLEISELTMGTYKHIGRMRFARLIGMELSHLYMKMNRHQQSIPFLVDLEKVFSTEKWDTLLTDVRKQILECYEILDDKKKQLRYSCLLASSPCLEAVERENVFGAAKELAKEFVSSPESLTIRMEEVLPLISVGLNNAESIHVTNSFIELKLALKSSLPEDIVCEQISVSLKLEAKNCQKAKQGPRSAFESNTCNHVTQGNGLEQTKDSKVEPELHTYHSSVGVGVKCPNINRCLKRSDSQGLFLLDKEPQKENMELCFSLREVTITPGVNRFILHFEPLHSGSYTLNQICIHWTRSTSFLMTTTPKHVCFNVFSEEASLKIIRLTTLSDNAFEIMSGIQQSIVLQLNCGTSHFPKGSVFLLKASRGLQLKLETEIESSFKEELSLILPAALKPFENYTIPLLVKAAFTSQRDASASEHQITLYHSSSEQSAAKSVTTAFHLVPPFMTNLKLHTCVKRKFVEILVHGVTRSQFELTRPDLKLSSGANSGLEVKPMVPQKNMVVTKDQTNHLLWEITNDENSSFAHKVTFSIWYKGLDPNPLSVSAHPEYYECDFKLNDYNTLFSIRAAVEPQKGSEFCRVGNVCNLNVIIERVAAAESPSSVMYEVIGDQSFWNISGRTAGVIDCHSAARCNLTFEILPLASGFLPLPTVRISKYVTLDKSNPSPAKPDAPSPGEAKLVAFDLGQVYNWSRATQVHVLPSSGLIIHEP